MFFFHSMIGGEEQLDFFELHICVKDYYFFSRENRLVGVAVIQLKDIVEHVSNPNLAPIYTVFFPFTEVLQLRLIHSILHDDIGLLCTVVSVSEAHTNGWNWLDDTTNFVSA